MTKFCVESLGSTFRLSACGEEKYMSVGADGTDSMPIRILNIFNFPLQSCAFWCLRASAMVQAYLPLPPKADSDLL